VGISRSAFREDATILKTKKERHAMVNTTLCCAGQSVEQIAARFQGPPNSWEGLVAALRARCPARQKPRWTRFRKKVRRPCSKVRLRRSGLHFHDGCAVDLATRILSVQTVVRKLKPQAPIAPLGATAQSSNCKSTTLTSVLSPRKPVM
jgi:hypothetical protein